MIVCREGGGGERGPIFKKFPVQKTERPSTTTATNVKGMTIRESDSLHCFHGVKGRLTARLARGRLQRGLSDKNESERTCVREGEREREKQRGRIETG